MHDDQVAELDRLALDLQELRRDAGSPSYAELVQRVARLRQGRGQLPAEARPGRTTVYDAFRTGRRRIDVELLLDIVRALGVEEADVERWAERCRDAQRGPEPAGAVSPEPVRPEVPASPDLAPAPVPPPTSGSGVPLILLCVAINLVGRGVVDLLQLPVYLDMVGTALAAIVLGPWRGAATGGVTNLVGTLISGPASIPFALVNVLGALLWGYGVRRWGMGRTIPRYLLLNVLVGVGCTLVAAPIVVLVFGGVSPSGAATITDTIDAITHHLVVSVFSSNLLTSVADKVITGFVVLALVETLPLRSRTGAGHVPVLAAPVVG